MHLIFAIQKEILKQSKNVAVNIRCQNAIVEAANIIVNAFGHKDVIAEEGAGISAWLSSDDKGMSSSYMLYYLTGFGPPGYRGAPHPLDPADFGRCYRMLKVTGITEIAAMERASIVWASLIPNWQELTALWEEESPSGACPKLYERMQELIDSAE